MTNKTRSLTLALLGAVMLGGIGGSSPAPTAMAAETQETNHVDLRPAFDQYRLTIKLQGRRDTCHIFSVIAALEFAVACKFDTGVGLSEEYLNWAANDVAREYRDGASFVELAEALKKWGVSEERFMPYSGIFQPKYQPSRDALDSAREIHKLNFRWRWIKKPAPNTPDTLDDSHIAAIRKTLRLGWPVVAGREHNIVIVGYDDDPRQPGGGSFIVRNSNVRSYREMSYAEVKAKSNAVLWIDLPLK